MKFTAALALATGAAAGAANGTAYTTVVQTAYTTYCPVRSTSHVHSLFGFLKNHSN